jgi:hypothetical protein
MSLAMSGRSDEASTELLWLWNHCLDIDEAWIGVRYSFLLQQLQLLAGRHEPTRRELQRLRDEAEAGVRAKSISERSIDDWLALNQMLGDSARSLAWFDEIKTAFPAGFDPRHLQQWLGDTLKENGRWADVALLYPNPLGELQRQREQLEAISHPPADLADKFPAGMHEQVLVYARESFREKASDLVHALRAAKRHGDAASVKEEALRFDSSEAMREALRQAEQGEPAA